MPEVFYTQLHWVKLAAFKLSCNSCALHQTLHQIKSVDAGDVVTLQHQVGSPGFIEGLQNLSEVETRPNLKLPGQVQGT